MFLNFPLVFLVIKIHNFGIEIQTMEFTFITTAGKFTEAGLVKPVPVSSGFSPKTTSPYNC